MRIAMIGTGYVGLVSGACFSEFGVEVTCVDKDAAKIERLSRGEMPIYEPGLDHLVASNMAAGRLRFTGDLKTAVRSEEHTSELQSHVNLVCRLLLEKKKNKTNIIQTKIK